MITDNEINSFIVQPLKQGVTLHAIIDACHSGTTLDLCIFAKRKSKYICNALFHLVLCFYSKLTLATLKPTN